MSAERGEIIPYKGQQLEVTRLPELAVRGLESAREERFYVDGEAVIGKYGVVGLVIIDARPEDRWLSYKHDDLLFLPYDRRSIDSIDNPSHFIDTSRGFKMIRTFFLPSSIGSIFAVDQYVGEPFIERCIRGGTLSEDFDEVAAVPDYAFGRDINASELLAPILKVLLPKEDISRIDSHHIETESVIRTYISFFGNRELSRVVAAGHESIKAAIANFDDLLSRLDRNRELPVRNLELSSRNPVLLPPGSANPTQ